jgi:DNA repair protein RecO (recombination protein O)
MAIVRTDAIVLRSYKLAEADRIVVCMTQQAGLVRAVARGARRMKSRFGAALEPFTLVHLTFYERENRELVTISEVEIVRSNFDLATRPEAAEVLAYIAELVADFAPPHEANEKLFRMVIACIDGLQNTPTATTAMLRYFEVWLLRLAGLLPDWKTCADCGAPISFERANSLDFDGRLHCHACSKDSGTQLTRDTQQTIAKILRLSPIQFATDFARFPPSANEQIGELTYRLITRALERRPRTVVSAPA